MYFSRLFKVKEGKIDRVREWMSTLGTSRRDEAVSTFEYENVTREVVALFKTSDDDYFLIGFNEANEPYKTGDPSVSINQEHSAFKKECLEPVSEKGEVLLDLKLS